MGIGSLILDGIGDTIRVSLRKMLGMKSIPAKRLINFAKSYEGTGVDPFEEKHRNIESIVRRPVYCPKTMALHRDGTVIVPARTEELQAADFYKMLGCDVQLGQPKLKISSADCILINEKPSTKRIAETLKELTQVGISVLSTEPTGLRNSSNIPV